MKSEQLLAAALGLAIAWPAAAQETPAAKAAAAFAAEDWPAAAKAYEAITRAEPEKGGAWFRLGLSRQALGENDGAIAAYEGAAGAGFNQQLVRFEMARSRASGGEAEAALKLLHEVAELWNDPDRPIFDTVEVLRETPYGRKAYTDR